MKHYLLVIWLLFPLGVAAQNLNDSNLPIVIINTDTDPVTKLPLDIPDSYKVNATMKIIYHPDGSRNYLTDQNDTTLLNYNGRIGIELRGSSSQTLPKKPYSVTTLEADKITKRNASILGMPKENDWVLNSLAFDPTLIRNYLSYDLARSTGNYAPRGVYCEVIINGNYKGLYILMEKIKIDSKRVNIVKMNNTDIGGVNLTGGYITKADKTTGGDGVAWMMPSYSGYTDFIHESPKPSEITSQQSNYIRNYFTNFQYVMSAQNASIENGFPSLIDVPSFIDFMLINELASNADAYQYSTFFHKDRNGKLRAGPIWDFDLTYGNDIFMWGFDRSKISGWQFDNGDNTGAKFWRDLYSNQTFRCYLTNRWNELTASGQPLNYQTITAKMDATVKHISEATVRENYRWAMAYTQMGKISEMKNWIQNRIYWINTTLGGAQTCPSQKALPLVITKINYHPSGPDSIKSNTLEFIEISNASNQPVSLTGVYFRELGINYQFPPQSAIGANDKLYLSSKASAFEEMYGTPPFGEFTRNLSNDSEKLVLADAFGNVIDSVTYHDMAPWPLDADGKGYYLQLTDINLDNSVASNWTISAHLALDVPSNTFAKNVKAYPNPTRSSVTVENNEGDIAAVEVFDVKGRKVWVTEDVQSDFVIIEMENLHPDIYLLKIIYKNGESIVQKISKLP